MAAAPGPLDNPTGSRTAAPAARGGARALGIAVAIACLVLVGAWAWPHVVPKNFGTVVPGKIYRSGELTIAALADVVRDHDIRTIIDFGAFEEGSPAEILEAKAAEALVVERHVLRLEGDGTGNPDMYLQALRIMSDPERQPVLIHCGAGSERTGCAVVLYRHIVQGVDVDRAYEEARRFSHDPERNPKLRPLIDYIVLPVRDAFTNDLPAVTLPDRAPIEDAAAEHD
jgi:hypothetical protein